jgi:hypothetical protein
LTGIRTRDSDCSNSDSNVSIRPRFDVLHFPDGAEESLKAPGKPSERVKDKDRWSALALKRARGNEAFGDYRMSRLCFEVREAVASSSVL